MKALLIIDMMNILMTTGKPKWNIDGVLENINTLSEHLRASGDKVIFIQHDGSHEGICLPHTHDWELLPQLNVSPDDIIVSKTANEAFYKTNLEETLSKHGVGNLVITGWASDFCVDSTVKSALTKEYNLTVIADAHTTSDRLNFKAKDIIDYFNWLWTDMTPTPTKIKVIESNNFLQEQ